MQGESLALAEEWLHYIEFVKGRSWKTAYRYRWSLIGNERPRRGTSLLAFLGDTPVWELTLPLIREWYGMGVHDKATNGLRPPSRSSRNNKKSMVRKFGEYLEKFHPDRAIPALVLEYEPKGVVARNYQAQPKPVDDLTWRALWGSELEVDDRVWLGECYFLGLRVVEMANLRTEDVDIVNRRMEFLRKGGDRAPVPYGSVIDDDLLPHLPQLGPFDEWEKLFHRAVEDSLGNVFVSPFVTGEQVADPDVNGELEWRPRMADLTFFGKRLKRVLRGARLPEDAFTPHQMRHSCGTNLWRAGVSRGRIMRIMNHSNYNTTLGYAEQNPAFDAERLRNQHGSDHDD